MLEASRFAAVAVALAAVGFSATSTVAQEFEPRTYSAAPIGLNFVAIGYGFVTGAVFMDPALPVEDVHADIHIAFARYTRTLRILELPSKIKVLVPWSSGSWGGTVEGQPATRDATGIGDARVVVETLFSGARAVSPDGMPATTRPTVWGARLQVVAPVGDYENDKLINLGSNRWTFIPEIGFSHTRGPWSFEGALGAWLFTDNDDFVQGLRLEQDPLLVAKFHAVRSIRPGFWWAVAAGYGYGGRTTVDGVPRATIQRNWRISAMLAYPLTPSQGVSFAIATGGNRGAGTDADAITVAYQVAWGG